MEVKFGKESFKAFPSKENICISDSNAKKTSSSIIKNRLPIGVLTVQENWTVKSSLLGPKGF
jgi:hypothetical protein